MNLRLLLKISSVLVLSLLLLVPLWRVESLIAERRGRRDEVVSELGKSAGYAQTLVGPLLIVPYERDEQTWTEASATEPRRLVTTVRRGHLVLLPDTLEGGGQLELERRARGIYEARIYRLAGELTGSFSVPANYGVTERLEATRFGAPWLALGVRDPRGLGTGLSLRVNGEALALEPGTAPVGGEGPALLPGILPVGVHARLPAQPADAAARTLRFALRLGLQGTGELSLAPLGGETRLRLSSSWPHPSFTGEFLPKQRRISSAGFEASWDVSRFATNFRSLFDRCSRDASDPACQEIQGRVLGVSFVDPVDHYLKSERATKYGFLFIGLTFAFFFLLEVRRRLAVHAVQYGLVGLALAVFFLLLLSLSEHLGFATAYGIASTATVLLITHYVVPVVGSRRRALGFGLSLGALYGVLYGILRSEDFALLAGSLLVFSVLALTMALTRRVNWRSFGLPAEGRPAE
jgi:inner membrane protein